MFARAAGLPALKPLDQYDFGCAVDASRKQIMELASLALVERDDNLALLGPSVRRQDPPRHRARLARRPEGLRDPLLQRRRSDADAGGAQRQGRYRAVMHRGSMRTGC